ncbi:ecdysteroid-regulated 16 kDa protein-like [Liolophura sinensis]|uniref:ecdysteroid-regulated 16 kDa protein-like n=1 Tax=Liolophura sinensis TaxID=3198878 RepID=UPI003158B75C
MKYVDFHVLVRSTKATIKSVELSGCSDSDVSCILKKGTNVTLHMTFTLKEDAKLLTAKVAGIIGPASIPFPLPNADACVNCGLNCPISTGTTVTYVIQLPIRKIYPQIKVVTRWSLIDTNQNVVTCFVVPTEIVS